MKRILSLGLVAGLLIAAALGWFILGWTGSGPAKGPTPVVIAQGSSMAAAARNLEQAGALSSAERFLLQAKLFGGGKPIRAGEYEIPAGASPSDILGLLQSGRTLQRFVIVPEGLPSVMVHDRLMRAPFLTGQVPVPEEGSVLPDSYSYQRGESRAAVLKRMQDAMTKQFDALWAKRKPGLPVNSRQEAITLASIVEKETGKPSERRMVAGVYTNRLRVGMPLQADPTVIYPVTKGRPLGRRILRSELDRPNGYNTYRMAGLPIGPIANPGQESIAAVLDPAETKAIYFVADGTGGHVFANSLAEHNANVTKWRAIRRARGEM
ncbi:MAG TPA: endolytic transglycosylase MltG [Allosphingosinicella sp.]